MYKLKKVLCLLMGVMVLSTSVLSGCGKQETTGKDSTANASTGAGDKQSLQPVNLVWTIGATKQADHDVVMAEVNKKLKEKLNVTLDLQVFDRSSYESKMTMMIAAGENFDLCFTSNWLNKFYDNVAKGAYLELDSVIEKNGTNMKKAVPPSLFDVAKVKGKIYAVPNYQIIYSAMGVFIQKELVSKYNFDVKNVKTLKDLEPFLENIKKNEPNLIPYGGEGFAGNMDPYVFNNEGIVSTASTGTIGAPVYMKIDDKSMKVFARYGTKEDKENMEFFRDWFNKGYIRKDVVTVTDVTQDSLNNKYAVITGATKPGAEAEMALKYKKEYTMVPIQTPYISAMSGIQTMTAINKNSKNPDRAMMLIDLVYTDKDVFNTLIFGMENTHYTKVSQNEVKVPDDSKYKMGNMAWMLGNQFNAYYMNGQKPGTWEETDKINKEAKVSIIRGFTFDPEPVKNELAQITSVNKEFDKMMYNPDFERMYNSWLEKLNKAGIQKVVDETQRQIDEWAKANGKK